MRYLDLGLAALLVDFDTDDLDHDLVVDLFCFLGNEIRDGYACGSEILQDRKSLHEAYVNRHSCRVFYRQLYCDARDPYEQDRPKFSKLPVKSFAHDRGSLCACDLCLDEPRNYV